MKGYTVYVHISPSGKRYYGITMQDVNQRWKNGRGYKGNKYFYRAIEKYGWDNFEHIIIARGLSEDEAKWLEIELIKEFDTTDKNKGYNITLGGEGTNGLKRSEETRKKQSENHSRYWKDKERSEETRRKISESTRGKQYSKETRDKIGKAKIGKNNPMAKTVICITTGRIFYTAREGEKYYGIADTYISKCCKGKLKYAGKYQGEKLIWRYLDIFLNECKYILL